MKTRNIIIAAAALLLSSGAFAQNASDFFLRNYSYRYRLNPAFQSEKAFLGLAVGSVHTDFETNMGLSSFLYPTDNGIVTGFNPAISTDDFMANVQDLNNLNFGLTESIIALGSWSGKGFSTFEANIRTGASFTLPGEMFRFLKVGGVDQTYDMSGLDLGGDMYAEFAFGHSRAVGNNLVVGARLKILIGLAKFDMNMTKFDLYNGRDKWTADTEGELKAAVPFFIPRADSDGNLIITERPPITLEKLKPAGLGAAVDFGATYAMGPLTLSAAVVDLGFLSWKYNFAGVAISSTSYKGAEDMDMNNAGQAMGNSAQDAMEELMEVAKFKKNDVIFRESEMIKYGINLGADMNFGFAHVGAFLSTRKSAISNVWDARLGASLNPAKWCSLSANVGANNFGSLAGGAFSVSLLGINFYLSAETNLGKVTPVYYVPLDPVSYRMTTGLNITFGRRRDVI